MTRSSFVIANLLILGALRVNWAVGIHLFDYTGETSPGVGGGAAHQLLDRLRHLILPSTALAAGGAEVVVPLPLLAARDRHPQGTCETRQFARSSATVA